MPITLPPVSRRRFLQGALAAGAAALLPRGVWASPQSAGDSNRLALLSDTHLHASRATVRLNVNMWDNFQRGVNQLLALDPLPANVLLNGDIALSRGEPEDYLTLIDALAPLREAGLPVHLGLGNHDNRKNITAACGLAPHRVEVLAGAGELIICPRLTAQYGRA